MSLTSLWPNGMWVYVMFDLPVKTKEDRKKYTKFRNFLYQQGLTQVQYSVYLAFVENEKVEARLKREVTSQLPEKGAIRIISISDSQQQNSVVWYANELQKSETSSPFALF